MIELLGLPGCGKTTYIKKHLNGRLKNPLEIIYNKNHIIQNINKVFPILYFFFTHPVLSIKILHILQKIHYTTFFRRIKMFSYLFTTLGVIYLYKKKYNNEDLIIDEGINQVLIYIMYESHNSSLSINKLWTLLRSFMADTIIYIDVDTDIILDRLKKRIDNHGSEVKKDVENNSHAIDDAIFCQNYILSLINKNKLKLNIIKQ